jgi:hypothetical protein
MLSQVNSGAVVGVDAYGVEIEVNAGYGEPKVVVSGFPLNTLIYEGLRSIYSL